jgi:hypothetical protein
MKNKTKQYSKLYFDLSHPGSYSGASAFIRSFKSKNEKENAKQWLLDQETYTIHRPIRKKFQRNKIIVSGIDDTWQADLVDVRSLEKYNDGIQYILTCIDVFSKYAWAIPIKNKTSKSIIEAFKEIFEDKRFPHKLQTDQGTEFINGECKKFLQKYQINLYVLNSEMKASIIERFNRTLKEKMWRKFTHQSSYKFIDFLQKLVDSYNNTHHRTINTKPIKVNRNNEEKIFEIMYGFKRSQGDDTIIANPKFKIGDKVRISKNKGVFEKGYTPNWTHEIFTIVKVLLRVPPVYIIKDYSDEIIKGVFYEQELQKVHKSDDVYKIDEVLDKRKRKNQTEYLVSWFGYPSKFNSWVNEKDIIKSKQ